MGWDEWVRSACCGSVWRGNRMPRVVMMVVLVVLVVLVLVVLVLVVAVVHGELAKSGSAGAGAWQVPARPPTAHTQTSQLRGRPSQLGAIDPNPTQPNHSSPLHLRSSAPRPDFVALSARQRLDCVLRQRLQQRPRPRPRPRPRSRPRLQPLRLRLRLRLLTCTRSPAAAPAPPSSMGSASLVLCPPCSITTVLFHSCAPD